MRILRRFVASMSTAFLCAASLSLWLYGCGGPPEPVTAPKAAQVVWGTSEAGSEPAPAAAPDSHSAALAEVDLDAPTEDKPAASDESAPTLVAPAAEASPEPEAEAEVEMPEPPAAAALPALDKELRAAVSKQKANAKKPATKKSATKQPVAKQPVAKKSETQAPVASTYSGPNACKAGQFSVPRVRTACATGGRAAAKAVMRDAISKALASGASLKCGSCHSEQQNYTLAPGAVAQLERWLAR